jgi:hypothetical protein
MSSRSLELLGSVIDLKRQIGRILFSLFPGLAYGHCVDFDLFFYMSQAQFLDWTGEGPQNWKPNEMYIDAFAFQNTHACFVLFPGFTVVHNVKHRPLTSFGGVTSVPPPRLHSISLFF